MAASVDVHTTRSSALAAINGDRIDQAVASCMPAFSSRTMLELMLRESVGSPAAANAGLQVQNSLRAAVLKAHRQWDVCLNPLQTPC